MQDKLTDVNEPTGSHGAWTVSRPLAYCLLSTSYPECDYAVIAEHLSVRLIIMQCSQFTFVCMYLHHTLISMDSLVTRAYRHDLHMVIWHFVSAAWVDPDGTQAVFTRPCQNGESGSKGQLCHKRAEQRKGKVIEWERSNVYRRSLAVTGKVKCQANQGHITRCTLDPLLGTAIAPLVQRSQTLAQRVYCCMVGNTLGSIYSHTAPRWPLCRLHHALTLPSSHFPPHHRL